MKSVSHEILQQAAVTLSGAFETVYTVHLSNDSYTRYIPENGALTVSGSGRDFFEMMRSDALQTVFEEDRDSYCGFLQKGSLLARLETQKACALWYRPAQRQSFDRELSAVTDGQQLILAVRSVCKQTEYLMEFAEERLTARYDQMTDALSRLSLEQFEDRRNAEIKNGTAKEFAVVVCDVNNLKRTNDTLGHKAGDQLIIDAAQFIGSVFSASPVYRFGGDEFTVVLQNRDYQRREELLQTLLRQSEDYPSGKLLVVSGGLAVYRPGEDHSFEEVFRRADDEMYRNKLLLKQQRGE